MTEATRYFLVCLKDMSVSKVDLIVKHVSRDTLIAELLQYRDIDTVTEVNADMAEFMMRTGLCVLHSIVPQKVS